MFQVIKLMALLCLSLCFFTSCDDADDVAIPTAEVVTIRNLHAPADVRSRETGEISQEKPFVYFNFRTGDTVPQAQANTTNWDIAFKGTTIIVNGGVNRAGNGGAAIVQGIFDEIKEVPASVEFRQDGTPPNFAIPIGSGQGWYNYNSQTFVVLPIPGVVLLFKDASGSRFAKVEILSYYKNAPAQPDAFRDQNGYFTFRYAYQEADSRRFE